MFFCTLVFCFLFFFFSKKRKEKWGFSILPSIIIIFRKGGTFCCNSLLLCLLEGRRIDLDLRRHESGLLHPVKVASARKLACQPKKGLVEIVVALRADVEILEILLPMEGDHSSGNLSLLDVNFISHKDH